MRKSSSTKPRNLAPWLAVLGGVILIHFFGFPLLDAYVASIVIYAGVNIVLAVSLNLVNGFTGQFSMGHAGFMAVGAYTSAFLSQQINQPATFVVALVCGGLLAAVVGYIVGLPSLRLKGDYLAIVTLGFGEIIRVVLLNLDFVGGARGLPNIPHYSDFGWVYGWVVVTVFFVWRMTRSVEGRECLAVREDEIAAEAMGVDTTKAKIRAFVVGAFFAGIAGGLFAHYMSYLTPSIFDFNRSFEVIIMVVLGGMGSITGSVVAAVFLTVIREALRPLQEITRVDFRMVIYSLVLIALMLTRPNGLFGTREWMDLVPFGKKRKRSTLRELKNGASN